MIGVCSLGVGTVTYHIRPYPPLIRAPGPGPLSFPDSIAAAACRSPGILLPKDGVRGVPRWRYNTSYIVHHIILLIIVLDCGR